jgi:hypothetical protein
MVILAELLADRLPLLDGLGPVWPSSIVTSVTIACPPKRSW